MQILGRFLPHNFSCSVSPQWIKFAFAWSSSYVCAPSQFKFCFKSPVRVVKLLFIYIRYWKYLVRIVGTAIVTCVFHQTRTHTNTRTYTHTHLLTLAVYDFEMQLKVHMCVVRRPENLKETIQGLIELWDFFPSLHSSRRAAFGRHLADVVNDLSERTQEMQERRKWLSIEQRWRDFDTFYCNNFQRHEKPNRRSSLASGHWSRGRQMHIAAGPFIDWGSSTRSALSPHQSDFGLTGTCARSSCHASRLALINFEFMLAEHLTARCEINNQISQLVIKKSATHSTPIHHWITTDRYFCVQTGSPGKLFRSFNDLLQPRDYCFIVLPLGIFKFTSHVNSLRYKYNCIHDAHSSRNAILACDSDFYKEITFDWQDDISVSTRENTFRKCSLIAPSHQRQK